MRGDRKAPARLATPALRLVQRVDYLVEACRGRRVLHLGCANQPYTAAALAEGSLLHLRLADSAAELWGLEGDGPALELMRRHGCERLVQGDLEALERLPAEAFAGLGQGGFDVIVAGEVIEHLKNPGLFLRGIQALMAPPTTLLLTTVNAYCGFRAAVYALRGQGGRREPIHHDHVAYYSQATLRRLAEACGLEVREALFYDLGREHRPHLRAGLRLVNAVLVRLAPQLADGLILACVRRTDPAP